MNAIILAAGMGTRLRPLTNEIPKCLVKVNDVPLVESQINFLLNTGITDITLVSGYKAETLDYLKRKYGVSIVFNDKYGTCNNFYSMYLVRDRLQDTYVVEGDVYMYKNCFTRSIYQSTYFSVWKENYKDEWGLAIDEDNRLKNIVIGNGTGYIMSGISYWRKEDALKICNEIERILSLGNYENFFWDNVVHLLYKDLNIRISKTLGIYEIDNLTDLIKAENLLR